MCCARRLAGLAMSDTWGTARRSDGSRRGASDRRDPVRALKATGAKAARVLLIGLDEVHEDCWTVLVDAGVRLERADDVEKSRPRTPHHDPRPGRPRRGASPREKHSCIVRTRANSRVGPSAAYGPSPCSKSPRPLQSRSIGRSQGGPARRHKRGASASLRVTERGAHTLVSQLVEGRLPHEDDTRRPQHAPTAAGRTHAPPPRPHQTLGQLLDALGSNPKPHLARQHRPTD